MYIARLNHTERNTQPARAIPIYMPTYNLKFIGGARWAYTSLANIRQRHAMAITCTPPCIYLYIRFPLHALAGTYFFWYKMCITIDLQSPARIRSSC